MYRTGIEPLDMGKVSSRIKKFRGERKQVDVANELGVAQQKVSSIEAGKALDVETLHRLSVVYGVSCDYILTGIESTQLDAHNDLGLSSKSINVLEQKKDDPSYKFALETIILDDSFMLSMIREGMRAVDPRTISDGLPEQIVSAFGESLDYPAFCEYMFLEAARALFQKYKKRLLEQIEEKEGRPDIGQVFRKAMEAYEEEV